SARSAGWGSGSVSGLLRRGAVVTAGDPIDDVLLVAVVLERLAQLGRGDRLDTVLEEEARRLRAQGGDSLAGLERTVVVVLDQDPAVELVQRLMDLDHVTGVGADDPRGLLAVEG